MIVEPVTLPPTATLRQADTIMGTYHISGVPITTDGGKLVGILTNRDIRFVEPSDYDLPGQPVMTPSRWSQAGRDQPDGGQAHPAETPHRKTAPGG